MKTCRRGHEYPSDKKQCPICQAEATKRYRQRNKAKRSKASVEYFRKHKDKKAANNKLYWERHPEKVEQKNVRFRKKNDLYAIWRGMISRCHREGDPEYPNYGGRGISVCQEWRGSGGYQKFVDDLPTRPSRRHTLERKDNDLGYSKENCKWATREEQGSNRRTNRIVSVGERSQTLSQWAREVGVSPTAFSRRINRGWPEDKLLQPANRAKQPQLNRERLLERVALTLHAVVGDMDYEEKHEVEEIMREVGLLRTRKAYTETDGDISNATT
jgi:hypothetical protein